MGGIPRTPPPAGRMDGLGRGLGSTWPVPHTEDTYKCTLTENKSHPWCRDAGQLAWWAGGNLHSKGR